MTKASHCLTNSSNDVKNQRIGSFIENVIKIDTKITNIGVPRQENGHDCGVFICQFAKHYCFNFKNDFCQNDITDYIRDEMAYELENGLINFTIKTRNFNDVNEKKTQTPTSTSSQITDGVKSFITNDCPGLDLKWIGEANTNSGFDESMDMP